MGRARTGLRKLNICRFIEFEKCIPIVTILSSGCHNELMSVRKKFITAREAVNDMKGNNGQPLMVPLTGSLYVRGKLSDNEKYIVGMYIFY